MQRSEMSDEQLRVRDSIVNELTNAGWLPTRWQEMFDEGLWTPHEVSMERMRTADGQGLQFVLDTEQQRVALSIRRNMFQGLTLYIFFAECLGALLNAIVRNQDTVAEENFKNFVREILAACPETYTAEDEDSPLKKVVP